MRLGILNCITYVLTYTELNMVGDFIGMCTFLRRDFLSCFFHCTKSMQETCTAVALTFFRSLKTFRLTFLRMRNKCQIINLNPYLPRVNLRQITLLGGYTHPNEQPVVFIP